MRAITASDLLCWMNTGYSFFESEKEVISKSFKLSMMLISYFLHFIVAPLRVNRYFPSVFGAYVLSIVEQSSSGKVKRTS